MIPTKQQVMTAAQFHLADELAQVYTTTLLEQPFQMSYRELMRALQNLAIPRAQTERYYDLPANTSVLDPATAGIADFGAIEGIEERGNLTSVSVTGATAGSGFVTIAAAGHPFITGDNAVLFGITGMNGINGIFAVTVVDANTFKANGATVTGTYVSGGTASKSGEGFIALSSRDHIEDLTITGAGTLGEYCLFEGKLHFPPCAGVRELRIRYNTTAPTLSNLSDTTGIDDSLDFLALRTAGLAAGSRGATNRAAELNGLALGPEMQADGKGGVLREMVASAVRALQATPTRRPPFRSRVNADIQYFA